MPNGLILCYYLCSIPFHLLYSCLGVHDTAGSARRHLGTCRYLECVTIAHKLIKYYSVEVREVIRESYLFPTAVEFKLFISCVWSVNFFMSKAKSTKIFSE